MKQFSSIALLLAAVAVVALAGGVAQANYNPAIESELSPEVLRIDEQKFLGVKINSEERFVDQSGREFTFGELRDKPVVLVLSYFTCDGFCPSFNVELRQTVEKVDALSRVKAGRDFTILTVSFDKLDDTASAAMFAKSLGLNDELSQGWTVATFADPTRIKHFADSLGYKFFWSPADRMFFHPNALFFVSPDGRVSRILHNAVSDARDMELAILDAKFSRMRPSEILNVAVSLCYSYNYKEGKYGLNYPLFIAVGSLVTGISAFAFAANVSRKKKSKINLGKGE